MADRFEAETILIYSNGEVIGDGLIKLPFIAAVRRAYPDAHITWATAGDDTVYTGVLASAAEPLLDEIVTGAIARRHWPAVLTEWRLMGGRRFDLVIDTQRNLARSLVLRRVRHGLFISAAGDYRLSNRRPEAGAAAPVAVIDQLTALLSLATGRRERPAPLSMLSDDLRRAAEALLPAGPIYVGVAPGAGGASKCWPLDRFVAVAREQVERGRVPVFLLGPAEADWLAPLSQQVPQALFPEWNRTDSLKHVKGPTLVIALAGRLAAAVANDSGTGHMLAAGGAPLVSLFTSKRMAEKFRPATDRLIALEPGAFGGGAGEIDAIPVNPVIAAVDRHIEAAAKIEKQG